MRIGRWAVVVAAACSLLVTGCVKATTEGFLPDSPGTGTTTGDVAAPGLTATTLRLGFVPVDLEKTSTQLGFQVASQGVPTDQINALVAWANANGGIGGRQVEAVIRTFEASGDSPESEEALCKQLTQDDKVFAVVLNGQFQPSARPCYAAASTLMLDQTLVPQSDESLAALSPYLWQPSLPSYDAFANGLMATLKANNWYEGATTLGIVAPDKTLNKDVVDDVVIPQLAGVYDGPVETFWIDTAELGTLSQGIEQAIFSFKAKKVSHVMFLGGERIAPFWQATAGIQNFSARYSFSTWDSPNFMTDNPELVPQDSLPGSIGVGFSQGSDTPNEFYTWATTDAQKECKAIFEESGVTFPGIDEARTALMYCDSVRFLKTVGDLAGATLNASSVARAAADLGDTFQAASGFGTTFTADTRAGGSAYSVLAYDTSCACYRYQGDPVPYPVTS